VNTPVPARKNSGESRYRGPTAGTQTRTFQFGQFHSEKRVLFGSSNHTTASEQLILHSFISRPLGSLDISDKTGKTLKSNDIAVLRRGRKPLVPVFLPAGFKLSRGSQRSLWSL